MPESRRNSRWCNALQGGAYNKVVQAVGDKNSAEAWGHGERYAHVNLQHMHASRDKRRIEVRHHSGSLNADKIIGWYKFLCEFVAETLKIVRAHNAAPAVQVAAPIVQVVAPIVRSQRRTRAASTVSRVVGVCPAAVRGPIAATSSTP